MKCSDSRLSFSNSFLILARWLTPWLTGCGFCKLAHPMQTARLRFFGRTICWWLSSQRERHTFPPRRTSAEGFSWAATGPCWEASTPHMWRPSLWGVMEKHLAAHAGRDPVFKGFSLPISLWGLCYWFQFEVGSWTHIHCGIFVSPSFGRKGCSAHVTFRTFVLTCLLFVNIMIYNGIALDFSVTYSVLISLWKKSSVVTLGSSFPPSLCLHFLHQALCPFVSSRRRKSLETEMCRLHKPRLNVESCARINTVISRNLCFSSLCSILE